MTSAEIGKIIKERRREMRMTQSQVVEGEITRNMLSQIESGAALPSFKTLQFLCERLGLSVAVLDSADVNAHADSFKNYIDAKSAFNSGSFTAALGIAESAEEGDVLYDEFALLKARCAIEIAESAYIRRDLAMCREYAAKAKEYAESAGIYAQNDYAEQAQKLSDLASRAADKKTAKKA
jgi:transcriptional regulator with XRE-family HTH domain